MSSANKSSSGPDNKEEILESEITQKVWDVRNEDNYQSSSSGAGYKNYRNRIVDVKKINEVYAI